METSVEADLLVLHTACKAKLFFPDSEPHVVLPVIPLESRSPAVMPVKVSSKSVLCASVSWCVFVYTQDLEKAEQPNFPKMHRNAMAEE